MPNYLPWQIQFGFIDTPYVLSIYFIFLWWKIPKKKLNSIKAKVFHWFWLRAELRHTFMLFQIRESSYGEGLMTHAIVNHWLAEMQPFGAWMLFLKLQDYASYSTYSECRNAVISDGGGSPNILIVIGWNPKPNPNTFCIPQSQLSVLSLILSKG